MGIHSLRKATRIRARDPWHLINIFGLQLHFISISSVTVRAKTRANRKLIISSARHSLSLILGFCHVSRKEKRGLRLGPGRAGDSSLLSHMCLGRAAFVWACHATTTNSATREEYICGIISLQIILKNVLFSFYSRILLIINHSELSSQ